MTRRNQPLSSLAVLRRVAVVSAPPWRRLMLAAVLGLAGSAATIGLLAGSGCVVDRAALHPGLGAIAGVLAIVEVLAFLRAPLRYGERLVVHDAAFRALTAWRVWLYDRLEPLAPAGLARWRSGDLLHRAIDDVDSLQDLYVRGLTPLVVALASCALALVVLGVLLPAGALVLAIALAVSLVVPPGLALALHQHAALDADRRAAVAADVVDLVEGAAELLAFGAHQQLLERIEENTSRIDASARRRALIAGAGSAVTTVTLGGAVLGVLIAGIDALRTHQLDPVLLAVLPLTVIAAFESVPPVAAAVLHLGDVVASGRRLLQLGDLAVPVVDRADVGPLPSATTVALRDVRLRYRDDLPWALDGLDLSVSAGERVAVIGPSGAGKSSLLHVLLRFWPITSGSARLGGTDLDRLAQADVRRRFALVDQNARLFAGSVRDNIVLGRVGASEDEIARVIAQAQLSEWITTLPGGLDTPVGEQGAQVSGGQRQRIAVARALLTDAPVLLLDEPTTGLDQSTADRLLDDVLAARGERSMLLVTHRVGEAERMDRVVVVDHGAVVDKSKNDEALAKHEVNSGPLSSPP